MRGSTWRPPEHAGHRLAVMRGRAVIARAARTSQVSHDPRGTTRRTATKSTGDGLIHGRRPGKNDHSTTTMNTRLAMATMPAAGISPARYCLVKMSEPRKIEAHNETLCDEVTADRTLARTRAVASPASHSLTQGALIRDAVPATWPTDPDPPRPVVRTIAVRQPFLVADLSERTDVR